MSNFKMITTIAFGASLLATSIAADARPNRVRTSGPNGSAVAVSGAYQNANGGCAIRMSKTTANPDGSGTRSSRLSASGARGTASSRSGVTRKSDGTFSGGRKPTATSAATDTTYNGSTQIDPSTGKPVRSGTCISTSVDRRAASPTGHAINGGRGKD